MARPFFIAILYVAGLGCFWRCCAGSSEFMAGWGDDALYREGGIDAREQPPLNFLTMKTQFDSAFRLPIALSF